MECLEEFKRKIKKVNSPRHYKITNSYGVYDGYKYYRKNKPKDKKYILTESQYFAIIRQVNQLLVEEFLKGNDIKLPERMGTLELRKFNGYVKTDEEGKLHTNYPINWESTLKLWHEDKESFKNKTLIRNHEKEIFKVFYNKLRADYNNKTFYDFSVNRDIKIRLKQKIKDKRIDAFKLNRYDK